MVITLCFHEKAMCSLTLSKCPQWVVLASRIIITWLFVAAPLKLEASSLPDLGRWVSTWREPSDLGLPTYYGQWFFKRFCCMVHTELWGAPIWRHHAWEQEGGRSRKQCSMPFIEKRSYRNRPLVLPGTVGTFFPLGLWIKLFPWVQIRSLALADGVYTLHLISVYGGGWVL